MTRGEFLAKLREALENELDRRTVQEQTEYYRTYIIEEMEKGRPEQEVLDELGDPWVIARSVIAMNEADTIKDASYRTDGTGKKSEDNSRYMYGGGMHVSGVNVWWKKVLLALGIVGVFLILLAVIGGIFSLLMPVIVPVILLLLIFRLIGGIRK